MLMHLFLAESIKKIYLCPHTEKAMNDKAIDRMCGRPYRERWA